MLYVTNRSIDPVALVGGRRQCAARGGGGAGKEGRKGALQGKSGIFASNAQLAWIVHENVLGGLYTGTCNARGYTTQLPRFHRRT